MVVVPMLQRLLATGSARLQRDSVAECGKVGAGDLQLEWTSVETSQRGDVQTQAGVYLPEALVFNVFHRCWRLEILKGHFSENQVFCWQSII